MDADCQAKRFPPYMIPFSPIHRQGSCISNDNKNDAGSDFFAFFEIFSGIHAGMTIFYGIKGDLMVWRCRRDCSSNLSTVVKNIQKHIAR
ncbi:MAG: hypothetical protein A2Z38_11990 [Planctomycetes bacterium RBG_19FT_COMBO_48_8]|nr:MAG: hypothetical protein A2Z38_11990 [Planctomycetes bacterium RBG_19FT_COMBO_48_8]